MTHRVAPAIAVVTDAELDGARLVASVDAAECGAVVVFRGVVRDHDEGQAVRALDYRAHPLAEDMLMTCCRDLSAETGLRVAAAHRTGHLAVGDVALIAAVSAAHRPEAFAACDLLVARIKALVPIWKRQYLTDGTTEWVGL